MLVPLPAAASVRRHGIDADLEGPVQVHVRAAEGFVGIRVADSGGLADWLERWLVS